MAPGTEGLSSTCGYSMDHYGSVWICMVDVGISRDSMISILHKRSETLGIPTNVTTLNSSMEISLEKSGSKNMCRVREKELQVKRWMMRKWMQNPTSSFFELKSHSWRFWVEWWGRWLQVGRPWNFQPSSLFTFISLLWNNVKVSERCLKLFVFTFVTHVCGK